MKTGLLAKRIVSLGPSTDIEDSVLSYIQAIDKKIRSADYATQLNRRLRILKRATVTLGGACGRQPTSNCIGCAPSRSATTHSSPRGWSTWWGLRQLDHAEPQDLDLHLILDNSGAHKTEEVRCFLAAHPRPGPIHTFPVPPGSTPWKPGPPSSNAGPPTASSSLSQIYVGSAVTSGPHDDESSGSIVWARTVQFILSRARETAEEVGTN